MQGARGGGAFTGDKATYLVLSSITILVLSLIVSIWHGDPSSSIAVIGLFSVYIGSSELLLLFFVLSPASIIIDILRLVATKGLVRAHGWLVFFTVLDMISKLVGGYMAWALHTSLASGEGQYSPISTNAPAGGAGGVNGGGSPAGPPGSYQPPGTGGFAPSADPFVSFGFGGGLRQDGMGGPPPSGSYQPFPGQASPAHAMDL